MQRIESTIGPGSWRRLMAAALGSVASVALIGCGPRDAGTTLRIWCHQGQEAEHQAMRDIAAAFNQAHANQGLRVDLVFFPDSQYTEKISIAAAVRDLPDALDLDGPSVAQFVEAGLLAPLDPWISPTARRDFLPTILQQGAIDGTLYAVGAFDSSLVLYYDRALLARAGIVPPPPHGRWNWREFIAACRALKAAGIDPIALHMNETADEWYTYAFSPLVWSVGGRLIAEDGRRTRGVLDAPRNIEAIRAWQSLFHQDFADPAPVDPNPFGSGATALDWTGHWMARLHLQAKAEDLGVMPLPLPGDLPAAPCGSWCWALSASTPHPGPAARWIAWVTDPERGIRPIVRANGAVPARASAFALFPEYERDPYRLFREQLQDAGRPRPRTPYYPALTRHFAAALRDIARGADVADRLGRAAADVQRVIDRGEKGRSAP